jgi:glycosyltransferase involved in cell wall biosynthesis
VLTIVLPAYNEAAFLRSTVEIVRDGLTAAGEPFEIVIVENGSTDDTPGVLAALAGALPEVRACHLAEPDYGGALREGILAATGDLVVIFDVDYYDLAFLAAATTWIRSANGPAIVVGSKRGEGALDQRPWHRRAITATFALVLRVTFGAGIPDTHGVKVLDRAAVGALVHRCRHRKDLFDSELILRAQRAGLAVGFLPVEVHEMRPPRSSVLRRVPRTLAGLVRLRWELWREVRPPAAP